MLLGLRRLAKRLLVRRKPCRPPPQLPDELLIAILEAVDEDDSTPLALCLASKRFYALVEPLLYRSPRATIRVSAWPADVQRSPLLTKLLHAAHLLPLATTLTLRIEAPFDKPPPYHVPLEMPTLPIFPNLHTLALIYEPHMPGLHWCNADALAKILRGLGPSCLNIVTLDLQHAVYAGWPTPELPTPPTTPPMWRSDYSEPFPALKRVVSLYNERLLLPRRRPGPRTVWERT
ncbi:Proteophosphoglycan ppg4 [Rhodotorula toruloides]|nr:Proteophosphoglycan ppg4 [Rhodotorula toruloides]